MVGSHADEVEGGEENVRSRCEADGQFRTIWHQELWRPGGSKAAVVARIEMVSIRRGGELTPLPDHVRELVLREGEA